MYGLKDQALVAEFVNRVVREIKPNVVKLQGYVYIENEFLQWL